MPVISAYVLVATLLVACSGFQAVLAKCTPSDSSSNAKLVDVYFGCGCFWHVQHEFVTLEMSAFCRQDNHITARTSYAGGTSVGPDGLVCYHNWEQKADYGELGHTEVVALTLPEANFSLAAERFWQICPGGNRRDPQDRGGEYRSVVGLPGGMSSPLLPQLGAGQKVILAQGAGNEGDTLNTGKVFIYDSDTFPAHVAEKYHQFHDDMMDKYSSDYHGLRQYAKTTGCPGDTGQLT